mgnify:CR=1 FL=1
MKKIFALFIVIILFYPSCYSETIKLKNDKIIDAEITEKADEYIKVNFHGVTLTYYVEDIISIDGIRPNKGIKKKLISQITPIDLSSIKIETEHIQRLLRELDYPKHTWPEIERELIILLTKIDFPQLKQKVDLISSNPDKLSAYFAKLYEVLHDEGCFDIKQPHSLMKLLINGLGKDDIFSLINNSAITNNEKETLKYTLLACAATTQLVGITSTLLGMDIKNAHTPTHIFNCLPLNTEDIFFADFSQVIFGNINVKQYYKVQGKYYTLKEEYRFAPDKIYGLKQEWKKGERSGKTEKALNLFYLSIYINNDYNATFAMYINRGMAYDRIGFYDQAIIEYNRAIQINPNNAHAYVNLGVTYAMKRDQAKSITNYNQAIQINPNNAHAYHMRGLYYKKVGSITQAINDLNRSLQIDQTDARAFLSLGSFYDEIKDFKQALDNYKQALEIDPANGNIYYYRAYTYAKLENYDKAWEDIHRAQNLGSQINPEFLQRLRQASGRNQ